MDTHDRGAVKFSRAIASNRYYICWLAVSFQEIKFCDPEAHSTSGGRTCSLIHRLNCLLESFYFDGNWNGNGEFLYVIEHRDERETLFEMRTLWTNMVIINIDWQSFEIFFYWKHFILKLIVETDRRRLAFVSLPRSVIRVWILNAILPVGISLRSNGGISWHLLANGSQWSALARVNPGCSPSSERRLILH